MKPRLKYFSWEDVTGLLSVGGDVLGSILDYNTAQDEIDLKKGELSLQAQANAQAQELLAQVNALSSTGSSTTTPAESSNYMTYVILAAIGFGIFYLYKTQK